jgi:hypothetical protein
MWATDGRQAGEGRSPVPQPVCCRSHWPQRRAPQWRVLIHDPARRIRVLIRTQWEEQYTSDAGSTMSEVTT